MARDCHQAVDLCYLRNVAHLFGLGRILRAAHMARKGLLVVHRYMAQHGFSGMPWFYVFIVRRYLGIEGKTGQRDNTALDRFLATAAPAEMTCLWVRLPRCSTIAVGAD